MTRMTSMKTLRVVALAALCALLTERVDAKCAMTQTCVNPGNVPDYDACIPEAHAVPADPQPMRGASWANVTGGGACKGDSDCNSKGSCTNGACACLNDGIVAGAHCELFAIQCPEYKDAACCSWQQNQAMAENFKVLANTFANNDGGGCDACAVNLLNLWCGLMCSPHQADFMRMHLPFPSINHRLDPMTGEENVKVLEMDVTLDKPFTCALYDSCKNTAIASVAEGMKSSLGFLNYQMQTGAIGHGEYMLLHFTSANTTTKATSADAFDHHVFKCSNYSEVTTMDIETLPTQAQLLSSIASPDVPKQCPCGACRQTCDDNAHAGGGGDRIAVVANPISLVDGFNGGLVAIVYGAIVAGAFWTHWRKQ
uniref:Niemann-Pick C1 N-terminal domain-containing protein n=1 Tax=Globisporangium ultimum (strain ATCC 200006 / CBS 805.95 / DAOM BR144) TaxID=431595 RepID=K3X0G1_GLOUD